MIERTCVLIKPDGVGKKVVGKILERLESEGFQLLGLKMLRPSREEMEALYEEHRAKPFFGPFLRFMLSGPVIASVWEGEDAIHRIRKIIGATNSREAAEGTLRRMYGTDNRRNLLHGSDSAEAAQREIRHFFRPEEILEYDPNAWQK